MKAVSQYDYKIKLLEGIEFTKVDLFIEYVNHFYNIKKISDKNSPQRFIAKLHLNTLYGIFGRRQDIIETINIFNKDLYSYVTSRIIKTIITINDEISTLLIHNNININILKELNITINTDYKSF